MDWEVATAIAEIAGAIAVLVTLIYLAAEVRQNRKAVQAASIDALSTGWNNLNAQITGDPELAQIMLKGFADPDSLDEVQLYRFQMVGQSYINHFMTAVNHHHDGTLRDKEWCAHSSGTAYIAKSPGGAWILEHSVITEDVRAALLESVDEELEQKERYLGVNIRQPAKPENTD